jgi:uncharacterized protein
VKIDLDKVKAEPVEWRETHRFLPESLHEFDVLALGEITWSGRLWAEPPGFRLRASLSYEQTVACARCLTPIVGVVESQIRLLILKEEPQSSDSELELQTDDLDVFQLSGSILDTEPVLREQLQLNVPMRTLCKEDCLGLCPECGINRNHDCCDCETTPADPRWEALRGLQH